MFSLNSISQFSKSDSRDKHKQHAYPRNTEFAVKLGGGYI